MATKRKQTRSASGSSGSSGRGRRKSAGRKTSGRQTAARSGGSSRPMDAIQLLKQDHREVERLVDEFDRARAPKKAQLAEQICRMLTVHAQIEEEIFYPAAREALKDEDLVDEAEVEHRSAKDLIAQIQRGDTNDDRFEARVKVLGEYVKHHVKEEENEMFRQLNSRRIDLQALGEQMMRRKQQLMGEAGGETMMDEDASSSSGGRGGRGNGRAQREESTTMNATAESRRS